jgi:hypothetical protein
MRFFIPDDLALEIGTDLARLCTMSPQDPDRVEPEKYGKWISTSVFRMRPHCWCEMETCPYCRMEDPVGNFEHHPTGLHLWWYKTMGRNLESNQEMDLDTWKRIVQDIESSILLG